MKGTIVVSSHTLQVHSVIVDDNRAAAILHEHNVIGVSRFGGLGLLCRWATIVDLLPLVALRLFRGVQLDGALAILQAVTIARPVAVGRGGRRLLWPSRYLGLLRKRCLE
jgi:hypothetical protein